MHCLNCNEPTSKYRCSKCEQYNCCLDCYKSHQQRELCVPHSSPSVTNTTNSQDETVKTLQMYTTEDTVTVENLEKLAASDSLKALLCNPHLREFLQQIDASTDAWKAMKIAMLEPLFLEFADVCLEIVEPPSMSTGAL